MSLKRLLIIVLIVHISFLVIQENNQCKEYYIASQNWELKSTIRHIVSFLYSLINSYYTLGSLS